MVSGELDWFNFDFNDFDSFNDHCIKWIKLKGYRLSINGTMTLLLIIKNSL